MELKGKTAIVTGSARGIGFGIARAFAKAEANVVISDMNLDSAADAARTIESEGGVALPFKANVTARAELDAMVAATVARFGALDILVNNAGIESTPSLLKDITEEQWDRVISVNLKGVFLCCQAVIPQMAKQGGGRIININSLAGRRMTFFGSADYTASKHGGIGLTQHLAWELADSRITVNAICPGAVLTPLAEMHTTPEYREMVTKRLIPLGRWCMPEDIAGAAIFLASDAAALVTGQAIDVDGGVMTGFGEDLRPIIRQRMEEEKAKAAQKAARGA
ncbi:SDR family oxidoreductase [Alsobacter sp. SYSU M60028]|uniref:SDR family oxidoreductase n=1 Tax=Alsobacter ponti TaxID=2962936 RepID=A0ABT1LD26_9HYPH|nr:SDR family NAD(P)-dependent oxidoreductase [Alsobacter ponti]MCP8939406.1 SDR family oxidoreductase [Alsobacter ponti]